jgi:hypothetical protein
MVTKKFAYTLFIILTFACISVFAQIQPYQVGENLEYEGDYSKLVLRGIDVADLTIKIENAPDSNNFLIKTEAVSKGGILKLFNFKFYQKIESIVDGKTFEVLRTVKRDEQADRVRDSEAVFDREAEKVMYVETNPKDVTRPPHTVASPIKSETQDIVSAIYMLRYLPLAVGKTFELSVSDSGLVYKVPVRVTARERRKSVLGKKWCFKIEPEIFGDDRLIERDGSMTIWITDDKNRVPIRANIDTSLGKIAIKLKKLSYNPAKKTEAK